MLTISTAAAAGVKLAEGDIKLWATAGRTASILAGRFCGWLEAPWKDMLHGLLQIDDVRTAISLLLNNGEMADNSVNEDSVKKKWARILWAPNRAEGPGAGEDLATDGGGGGGGARGC